MQDLQIECEKCGTTLTIVREWPDGWKYRATVEPCFDCMEEAAQQKMQPTLLESEPILDKDGELVGTRSVAIKQSQSG